MCASRWAVLRTSRGGRSKRNRCWRARQRPQRHSDGRRKPNSPAPRLRAQRFQNRTRETNDRQRPERTSGQEVRDECHTEGRRNRCALHARPRARSAACTPTVISGKPVQPRRWAAEGQRRGALHSRVRCRRPRACRPRVQHDCQGTSRNDRHRRSGSGVGRHRCDHARKCAQDEARRRSST